MKSIVRSLAVEMALQQRAMGRRIAELRERSRMTQEIAADKAGVTLRAYQKWEAGGGIQYANLAKLAEVFRVPVERITGEDATPDPFSTAGQLDRIETLLIRQHQLILALAGELGVTEDSPTARLLADAEEFLAQQEARDPVAKRTATARRRHATGS